MRRVVVTGLGMVAPTGLCVPDAWQRALSGRSAVTKITQFDASGLTSQIAAEVKSFDPSGVMGSKEARRSSRFIQFAAVAAKQALDDSGLELARESGHRYGCAIGVGIGNYWGIEEGGQILRDGGQRKVSPFLMAYAPPNMAAGYVSAAHGLRGPVFSTATACASGTHAIGEAFLHIAVGTCDGMLAGGCESCITPLCVASFGKMGALSTRNEAPDQACRPFDRDRDGFVIGEGCGMVVLEEYEHARKRGARIYAELAGYGLSGDAYHVTLPPPGGDGLVACTRAALESARILPEEVDYINAHGTSTPVNDACESAAILTVFGQHAQRLSISSTKGVTGHCLGGAGGIEAVYTVLAVSQGLIPPTANYQTPDPACPLDYTPGDPRERPIRYAISNSCGFGGQNACLVLKRFA